MHASVSVGESEKKIPGSPALRFSGSPILRLSDSPAHVVVVAEDGSEARGGEISQVFERHDHLLDR